MDRESHCGQLWAGLGAALDDGGRGGGRHDGFDLASGSLERVSTGAGVALLAVQVCDFPSLKVLFGERVAAGAVDLFESRLRDIFRDGDAVVRTSSNEFHVMLESCGERRVAAEAAQRGVSVRLGLDEDLDAGLLGDGEDPSDA